ncbi:3-deoxy-manno-octulosonate cytidylyltransferase 2 [Vibrio chagasii]|nr:3-deoxy-manno-octulosonate cytidylyltransferase 2 [Vibrio chagasii]CAH7236894.1 3-deoxy-manno-octulosonate cytidylyltransferase 2 [Vibrio chagasii]CAH7238031.1 3-deoxy-manno-octulosonate cytidylyltransferase 2 [Vibrio chagasii]CAH7436681.1 3-deoxy-manno-octulosonate cytidylyltransferase 2 [Vibrio chagasii]
MSGINKGKIKVVIPARYGSSRLLGKPLLLLCGKPIFWHVFQRVLEAGVATEDIVVATDHDRILAEASQFAVPCVMTSSEHISGTDRLNEVASQLQWGDETLVINVQGDEPLIPSALIRQLIRFTLDEEQFDITTVISPLHSRDDVTNPSIVKVAIGEYNRAVYFSRSAIPFNRDNPHTASSVYRHIGIYAYSVKSLRQFCQYPESALERIEKLEQLRALSNGLSIGATIVDQAPPHGIDTEQDYLNLKKIMEK